MMAKCGSIFLLSISNVFFTPTHYFPSVVDDAAEVQITCGLLVTNKTEYSFDLTSSQKIVP